MKPLLEIKNLHVSFKTYLGTFFAVRGVNFHVDNGETIAIVGESGCGKSVSAKAIVRLISKPPGSIDSGTILFDGENLLNKTSREMEQIRGKDIGMIFQDYA